MQSTAEICESIAQQWFHQKDMKHYGAGNLRSRYAMAYNQDDNLDDKTGTPTPAFKRNKKSQSTRPQLTTVNVGMGDNDSVSKLTGVGADGIV